MTRSQVSAGVMMLAGCVLAHAQGKGGGAAPTGGGAPGNRNAEATSDVGKYSNWDQLAAHQHGSQYFAGKVVMAGGGQLPWDPIPVIVSCNGVTRYDTQTDMRGAFEIEAAARQSEVVSNVADTRRLTPTQLVGCDVHAVLGGFESTTVAIGNRSIVDNPDIGTITLHRDEKAMGAAVSATTATAPKDALKNFDKAHTEAGSKHLESAQHDLEKAVKIDPQFAEAWYQLGKIDDAIKPQDAADAYAKSAAADAQFLPPYVRMAELAAKAKRWQETVDATDHALKLDPEGTPQVWYFNAVGNFNLGKKDVAEASARRSLAMDPSHLAPNTEQLLAVMLAGRGDYAGALEHLRSCLTYAAPGPNAEMVKQQVAQLEKLVPGTASK